MSQGNYPAAQTFYRYFPYPGNGHCGGGTGPQINEGALFSTLVNWVENGVAPDFVVGSQNLGGGVTRTRKICMYPNVPGLQRQRQHGRSGELHLPGAERGPAEQHVDDRSAVRNEHAIRQQVLRTLQ